MRDQEIADKYTRGVHASALAKEYGLSTRQIQRICKKLGVIKTRSESYRLAIKQGRMKYYKKPEHLKVKRKRINDYVRFRVLGRAGFKCVSCGSAPDDGIRLEIDHIDNDRMNNTESNLQVLCNRCNQGKAYNSPEWKELQEDRKKFYAS